MFPEVDQAAACSQALGASCLNLKTFMPVSEQPGPGRLRANPTAHMEASNYQQRRSYTSALQRQRGGRQRSPVAPGVGTWRAEELRTAGYTPPALTIQPGHSALRQPLGGPSISFHLSPEKPPEPQDALPPWWPEETLRKPKVTHTFQLSHCHLMLSLLPKSQRAAGRRRQAVGGEGRDGRQKREHIHQVLRLANDDGPESQRDLGSLPQSGLPVWKEHRLWNALDMCLHSFSGTLHRVALGRGRTPHEPSEPCSLHSIGSSGPAQCLVQQGKAMTPGYSGL